MPDNSGVRLTWTQGDPCRRTCERRRNRPEYLPRTAGFGETRRSNRETKAPFPFRMAGLRYEGHPVFRPRCPVMLRNHSHFALRHFLGAGVCVTRIGPPDPSICPLRRSGSDVFGAGFLRRSLPGKSLARWASISVRTADELVQEGTVVSHEKRTPSAAKAVLPAGVEIPAGGLTESLLSKGYVLHECIEPVSIAAVDAAVKAARKLGDVLVVYRGGTTAYVLVYPRKLHRKGK